MPELLEFAPFSEKIQRHFAVVKNGQVKVKIVAPEEVKDEVAEILAAQNAENPDLEFSLCGDCKEGSDVIVVAICEFARSPCLANISYDQFGKSGVASGTKLGSAQIIRDSDFLFPMNQYFCPTGTFLFGGLTLPGTSEVAWFEFAARLSIRFLMDVSPNDIADKTDGPKAGKTGKTLSVEGDPTNLDPQIEKVELISLFEGKYLNCRNTKVHASVDRLLTVVTPSADQTSRKRACVVSGHEMSARAQAELMVRCVTFSINPVIELKKSSSGKGRV